MSTFSTINSKQSISIGDPPSVMIQKLLPLYQRCIEVTLQNLKPEILEEVARLIIKANRVCFFGQFGNGVSARMGEALFMQSGLPAVAYTDISTAMVAASQLKEHDVAFGISSSGRARTPVDALRIAKMAGAATVGITGFIESPLSEVSDIVICYNLAVEDIRLVHTDRLCESIILGVIQNCILSNHYDAVKNNMKLSKDAFLSVRYE